MSIKRQELVCTTDSSGAGTATTQRPLGGVVVEIRNNSAGFGGTADYTFTRAAGEGGGTVGQYTDLVSPFSVYPGGSVFAAGTERVQVPVEGYLTMTVAQGAATTGGTVHVYYES